MGDNMKYKILESITMLELEGQVAEYMEAGWICKGGIAVIGNMGAMFYFQAMVIL